MDLVVIALARILHCCHRGHSLCRTGSAIFEFSRICAVWSSFRSSDVVVLEPCVCMLCLLRRRCDELPPQPVRVSHSEGCCSSPAFQCSNGTGTSVRLYCTPSIHLFCTLFCNRNWSCRISVSFRTVVYRIEAAIDKIIPLECILALLSCSKPLQTTNLLL